MTDIRVGEGLRWLRAAWIAAGASALAALGHLAGGGRLPGAGTLLTLLGLIAFPLALFLGRQVTGGRLLALLIGAQLAAHAGLTLTVPHGAAGHGAAGHGAAGHEPGHLVAGHSPLHGSAKDWSGLDVAPAAPPGTPGPLDPIVGADVRMWAVHLACIALTWWWLARAERAVFALLAHAAGTAGAALARTLAHRPAALRTALRLLRVGAGCDRRSSPGRAPSPSAQAAPSRRPDAVRHVVIRRGPPARVARPTFLGHVDPLPAG